MKKTLTIDGSRVVDLESFYDEISANLIPGAYWGRNRDAFNDILRGGFGTPDDGFVFVWRDSEVSRRALGATAFDELVDIIRNHCSGGREAQGVELRLE